MWDRIKSDPILKITAAVMIAVVGLGALLGLLSLVNPYGYGRVEAMGEHGPMMSRGVGAYGTLGSAFSLISRVMLVMLALALAILAARLLITSSRGLLKLRQPADATVACPKCHASVDKSYRFCPQCRAAIQIRCSHCGQEMKAGWSYCASCGKEKSQDSVYNG